MVNLWDYRPCVWEYRESTWTLDSDLHGYLVEATDGDIGTVVRARAGSEGSFLVVETRLFEGRRLVPALAVASIRHDARSVQLALTAQQVGDAPCYELDEWNDAIREQQECYFRRLSW